MDNDTRMSKNMAPWDRVARLVIAAGVLVVWMTVKLSSGWLTAVLIIGAIFLVTAITGFCPLYRLFGKNVGTKRPSAPVVPPQTPPVQPM